MRVGFVLGAMVACSGGGGSGDPDAVTIDAAVIDGAVIDGAAIDGAVIDGAAIDGAAIDGAAIDGAVIDGAPIDVAPIDGALIDGSPIDATSPCAVAPPVAIATPRTTRPWALGEFGVGRLATFELATPVALESLVFETQEPPPLSLRAGCTGPVIATGVGHQRWFDVVSIAWTDGVATNLAAGSYVFELSTWFAITPGVTLEVHGVIADGEACTDPLVAAGVLACSPRANCTGVCAVAACSNGVDDDGDGLADDADPGCALANDVDETDGCVTGGPCPECADAIDTDNDGLVAWPASPGCDRAGDAVEHACPDVDGVIEVLTRGPYPVPQTGTADHPSAPHCWQGGVDRVFALRIPGDLSDFSVGVGQNMFTLTLYRDNCDSEPVQCYPAVPGWPSVPMGALAAGTYWLVASARSGPSTQLSIGGLLVSSATCDPNRPAFACPSAQRCQPAVGGGHRCQ